MSKAKLYEVVKLDQLSCPLCKESSLQLWVKSEGLDSWREQLYKSREVFQKVRGNFYECHHCQLLISDLKLRLQDFPLSEKLKQATTSDVLVSHCAAITNASLLFKTFKPSPRDRVLEVASSGGEFLQILRANGYKDIFGIEPSISAFQSAPLEIQKVIFLGEFKSYKQNGTFDIICTFQSIEHFDSLELFFTWCKIHLKPSGKLVLTCHHYKSIVNRVLGKNSPIYDYQHFHLFSPRALRKIADLYGFHVETRKSFFNFYPLSYFFEILNLKSFSWMRKIIIPYPLGNLFVILRLKDKSIS